MSFNILTDILQHFGECASMATENEGVEWHIDNNGVFELQSKLFPEDSTDQQQLFTDYLEDIKVATSEIQNIQDDLNSFCKEYSKALQANNEVMPTQKTAAYIESSEEESQEEKSPPNKKQKTKNPTQLPDNQEHNVPSKKRRGNLPKESIKILRKWLEDHEQDPYPGEEEKNRLATECKLTLNQISNWFINARRRILPLLRQETREPRTQDMDIEDNRLGSDSPEDIDGSKVKIRKAYKRKNAKKN